MAELDLEKVKEREIKDFGGCRNCGSKDIEVKVISKSGKSGHYKMECKKCHLEWERIEMID